MLFVVNLCSCGLFRDYCHRAPDQGLSAFSIPVISFSIKAVYNQAPIIVFCVDFFKPDIDEIETDRHDSVTIVAYMRNR